MEPVKAIIFDGSGTLLNDIEAVWKANSEAYQAFGLQACRTLEEFKEKFRMPIPEFHLGNGVPPQLLKDVDRKFRQCYPGHAARVCLFPEVVAVLRQLGRQGISLGIASSIPGPFLREHLKKLEIENFFVAVTGQDDCDEQKPSPKPILVTTRKLAVSPGEAMYVGDMEEDIIAGKKAHVTTTAIVRRESYQPRWRLERQSPDYLITSLTELLG
ncbi:MAG: HAD family hydrolase [Chloroflexi bacterium]|nr:HAD family hydrolase [Chloroflexota bacterium]